MSQMAPFTDAARRDRRNELLEHVHLLLHLRCRDRDGSRLEPARPLRTAKSRSTTTCARCGWRMESRTARPGDHREAVHAARMRAIASRKSRATVRFANDFFDKYIEGRELPDFATLFARAGLVLRQPQPAGGLDRRAGRNRAGRVAAWTSAVSAVPPSHQPVVASPSPGSCNWGTPAFAAGLEEADVITAVDGQRCRRRRANGRRRIRRAQARRPDCGRATFATAAKAATTLTLAEDPTMEVVAIESTGAALTRNRRRFAMRGSGPGES